MTADVSSVLRTSPSGVSSEVAETAASDTIPGTTATTAVIGFNAPGVGFINSSIDTDWFKVHLDAGVRYWFSETMSGTPVLQDPNLELRDAAGLVLASYGHNSVAGLPTVAFTATTTGDYYLSTSSKDGTTGAYSIQFDDKIMDSRLTAFSLTAGAHTLGVLETPTDADWYAVTLTAGQTYDFTLSGHEADGIDGPVLELHDALGAQLAVNSSVLSDTLSAVIHYTAATSGTFYISALSSPYASPAHRAGVYDIAFDVSKDVYSADTTTTGTVSPGGSVSSAIDTDGDHDWYAVNLQGGKIYDIDLVGSGANPLQDAFLEVLNAGGTVLTSDDDSGGDHNAHVSFYVSTSGIYYISAESFENSLPFTNIGTYTLSVGNAVTPTIDTIAGDASTTASLTLGQAISGRLDIPGDSDWYSLTLTGGQGYDFDVKGVGGDNVSLSLYDANGTLIAKNDDFGTGTDAHLDFEPPANGGHYFLAATGSGTQYGNYTISATNGARPLLTESIDWGTKLNPAGGVVHVYFAQAGETYDGETSLGWNNYEQQQAMAALNVYSNYINLTFVQTTDASQADFKLLTVNDLGSDDSSDVLAYMNPPGTINAGVGVFGTNLSYAWSAAAGGALDQGGLGFDTLLHEFGHGLGLAHPFDSGGTSTVMTGVLSTYDYDGYGGQNQGVFTVMSYNDGWPGGYRGSYGLAYDKTPMAIDVAALQAKYGPNATFHSGNDTYFLEPMSGKIAPFESIWDTGGTDTISAQHLSINEVSVIDLRSASMYYYAGDYSANNLGIPSVSGGALSYVSDSSGGYSIDAGVTIENAIGHAGSDTIFGGDGNNDINGMGGTDYISAGGGDDKITIDMLAASSMTRTVVVGGDGNDTLYLNVPHSQISGQDIPAYNYLLLFVSQAFVEVHDIESFVFTDGTYDFNHVINRAPTLTGTLTATINSGGTHVIRPTELFFTDPNDTTTTFLVQDIIDGLTGNVYPANSHGWLTVDGVISTSFTSQQLTNGEVAFVNDGSGPASFKVTAFDGQLGSQGGSQVFTFNIATGHVDNDTITGTAKAEKIATGGGNDYLNGAGGDDTLTGGAGSDTIDGGAGNDTAVFALSQSQENVFGFAGNIWVYDKASHDLDKLSNIETLQFADTTLTAAQASAGVFNGEEYVASNPDLLKAFGSDTQAATQHFINYGHSEGRAIDSFNAEEYLASNSDLLKVFGSDTGAALDHYVNYGYSEHRPTTTFNAEEYLASNPDLLNAFGSNAQLALDHYVHYGYGEHRPTATFNAEEYLASNPDLLKAFGSDTQSALDHYVHYGYGEHRATTSFDVLEYIASNPDLINAFGANTQAGLDHYTHYGYGEHRATTSFNAAQYLANYPDLAAAFGHDLHAAELHYILYGYAEHRTDHAF